MVDAHAAVLRRIEDVIAILARHFGLIHGLVGLAQQLIGLDVLGLRIEGHAQAGRDLQHQRAQLHWRGSGLKQPGQHRHAAV